MSRNDDSQVLSKSQNYRLWRAGAYGNKLRSWESLRAWRLSGYRGLVALRCREGQGGGPCVYDVDPGFVTRAIELMFAQGAKDGEIMVNEMAPNKEILQGEYLNAFCGAGDGASWGYFHYSQAMTRMRHALCWAPKAASGLRAELLLQQHMTPASYEDWRLLVDKYPDHVLEVSVYDCCLGDLPNRNALVWEVRKY